MLVDEADAALQAAQAALHAAEHVLRHLVVLFLQFALEVGDHGSDGADNRDQQGPEGHGAQVMRDGHAQRLMKSKQPQKL